MNIRRVLVVEDDLDIGPLVQMHLHDLQCETRLATSGEDGLTLFERERFDLVVLDLMLPGIDGLEVCRRLRALPGYVPILMLTAKSSELDRVVGLEMGADDYVAKPFSIPELMARVKSLFRRDAALREHSAGHSEAGVFVHDQLEIDRDRRRVQLEGEEIALTPREFDLLLHFARHPGRVYTRVQLLDQVWGYNHDGYEHTVNSSINRLRAKIEDDPANPRYVLTVWGIGYKFTEALAAP